MKEKTKKIFKDFKSLSPKTSVDYFDFVKVLPSEFEPPPYLVKIIFLGILGFKNHGRLEKVSWHTYFFYKKRIFLIHDQKFSSWTIEAQRDDKETRRIAKEIENRINKATRLLDDIIYDSAKSKSSKYEFFLNNHYSKLYSYYDFYRKKTIAAINDYKKILLTLKKKKKEIDIIKFTSGLFKYEDAVSKYCFSLILSFFSLLEFLLIAFYVFEQKNITLKRFEKFNKDEGLRWNEKFKIIFNIQNNQILNSVYQHLFKIKKIYRNPLTHGMTNELSILIYLPAVGLVPRSYKHFKESVHYGFVEIHSGEAKEITETFNIFLKFIEKKRPYNFYVMYLKSGFSIPLITKRINEIRKYMTSVNNFKNYLQEGMRKEAMIRNMDI